MIFLTDKLDIENLKDEKYIQPFYLMLRDSEHETRMTEATMPNIGKKAWGRHVAEDSVRI
jgi:hypothetical protein